MGVYVKHLIPIDHIITDLVDMTDEQYIRMKPMLYKWSIYADKKIKSYYPYKRKHIVTTVQNCCVEIPCDAVFLFYIIIGNPGCECWKLWNTLHAYNHFHEDFWKQVFDGGELYHNFVWSEGGAPHHAHFNWELQGNSIVIEDANLEGKTVTLLYYGYQEDEDGKILVWDTHADPISSYLKSFLAKKEQWRNFKRMKLTKMEEIYVNKLGDEYHRDVRHARANDNETSPTQERAIFDMINDPCTGKGNLYL